MKKKTIITYSILVLTILMISIITYQFYAESILKKESINLFDKTYLTERWKGSEKYIDHDFCKSNIFRVRGELILWVETTSENKDEVDYYLFRVNYERSNILSTTWNLKEDGKITFDGVSLDDVKKYKISCNNIDDNDNPERKWNFRYPLSDSQKESLKRSGEEKQLLNTKYYKEWQIVGELEISLNNKPGYFANEVIKETGEGTVEEIEKFLREEIEKFKQTKVASKELNQFMLKLIGKTVEEYGNEALGFEN